MSFVENLYSLYYKGNYTHDILLQTKQGILESAIEAKGESVANTLLAMLDLETETGEHTKALLAGAERQNAPYIRALHQKTSDRWKARPIDDEELAARFAYDLLQKASDITATVDTKTLNKAIDELNQTLAAVTASTKAPAKRNDTVTKLSKMAGETITKSLILKL